VGIFSTLSLLLAAAELRAAPPTAATLADTSSATREQLRQAIEQSGMTPEQVQQRLNEAGVSGRAPDADAGAAAVTAADTVVTGEETGTGAMAKEPAPLPSDTLSLTMGMEPFGAEIFRYSPTTFEPLTYGPVGPDYVIGRGDELVLTLWGGDQLILSLPVNREGQVTLPEAGQVDVNGLTLEGARVRLRAALATVYSGLRPAGQRSSTFLSVSLGKLRSIQVFILGQVVRPGGYTVSSVSRVLNALYAAGGPSRSGSMRDVRVLRGGQVVGAVDLYDVILRGDTSKEARLEDGDVIFVPPAGRRVALQGPVRRPGLFELRPGEHLRALLEMAGGVLATADVERAQIDRVVPPAYRDSLRGQDRIAVDVPLNQVMSDSTRDLDLEDADRMSVFPITGSRMNTVTFRGRGALKPGAYEYQRGMSLKDLVERAGGLTPDAYSARAQIVRTAPDRTRSALRVNLAAALAGDPDENITLEPLDEVTVATRWDMEERGRVTVLGLVRKPGEYELLEGMTLADLLFRAGGLTDEAFPLRAEVSRVDSLSETDPTGADTFSVALARDFAQMPQVTAITLRRRDAVYVRRDPRWREQDYVVLSGELRFPGTYALSRRDERVADLVRRAGGLTELAYPRGAVFKRAGIGRIGLDLPEALKKPRSVSNLTLERRDTLTIPRYQPVVTIEGAVQRPGATLYKSGQGLGYYITQASGFRRDADRRALVVVLANGDVRRKARPDPGSRILVPARSDSLRKDTLKDVASLLSIVASAATTIFLVQQATK
jgi:protein involved in polysaccharide export with SLBB domain